MLLHLSEITVLVFLRFSIVILDDIQVHSFPLNSEHLVNGLGVDVPKVNARFQRSLDQMGQNVTRPQLDGGAIPTYERVLIEGLPCKVRDEGIVDKDCAYMCAIVRTRTFARENMLRCLSCWCYADKKKKRYRRRRRRQLFYNSPWVEEHLDLHGSSN